MSIGNTDLSGQKIGHDRYEVIRRLDKGSMGYVYLAWDRSLEAQVVIKVPKIARLEDPEFRMRFERESKYLVKMSHPHIIRVIDVGTQDNIPYYVMQYVSGGSLRDRMYDENSRIKPMPLSTLSLWLLQNAKALDFVHSQSLIHRDVKPANILFDEHNNPYLSDFGLSKLQQLSPDETSSHMTAAGAIVGTPNYVAPEIVLGKAYDGRADQYSLAISVYEVLTGRAPLEGPTASATMVNQTSKTPPLLSEAIMGCPLHMAHAVAKALSKDPERRFNTCVEFANAILNSPKNGRDSSDSISTVSESAKSSMRSSSGSTVSHAPAVSKWVIAKVSRGTKGKIPCPSCQKILLVSPEHARKKATCRHCQAKLAVGENLQELAQLERNTNYKSGIMDSKSGSQDEFSQVLGQEVFGFKLSARQAIYGALGLVATIMVFSIFLGYRWAVEDRKDADGKKTNKIGTETSTTTSTTPGASPVAPEDKNVFLMSTDEDKVWVNHLITAFTEHSKNIDKKFRIFPVNSQLFAKKYGMNTPGESLPNGWAPSSAIDLYLVEQSISNQTLKIEPRFDIMHSPFVCLMPEERAKLLNQTSNTISLQKIAEAVVDERGWGAFSSTTDWGKIKLAMPAFKSHGPEFIPLIILAWQYQKNVSDELMIEDVKSEEFQELVIKLSRSLVSSIASDSNSYVTLIDEVISNGKKADIVIVPEYVALQKVDELKSEWGTVRLMYLSPGIELQKSLVNCVYKDKVSVNSSLVAGIAGFGKIQDFADFANNMGYRTNGKNTKKLTVDVPIFKNHLELGVQEDVSSFNKLKVPSTKVLEELAKLVEELDLTK